MSTFAEKLGKEVRKTMAPVEEGTVLTFAIYKENPDKVYRFAGVFSGGNWHFTGAGLLFPARLKHSELAEAIAKAELTHQFEYFSVGTEFEEVNF